jgi:hypothetical protein
MGVLHTPDFFVIRQQEAGWEEWKTEEELHRLKAHNSNRYSSGEDGQWFCPPGAAYAERHGLYYRVRSSAEIDWVFQRNIQFLEDYLRGPRTISASSREIVIAYLSSSPGMTLDELLRMTEGRISPDDIFSLIAANIIPVDLHAAPLAEPRRVQLQAGPEVISKTTANLARNPHTPVFADLLCGSTVNWDGHLWNVVNLGETSVSLLSDDQRLSELPRWLIESLIGQNRIEVVTSKDSSKSAISERLSRARESDLCAANQRVRLISDYLVSGKLPVLAPDTWVCCPSLPIEETARRDCPKRRAV